MKKTIILLSSLVSIAMFGQEHHHEDGHYCAADVIRAEMEQKYPEMKIKRLEMEKNLRQKGVEGVLRESGFSLSNTTLGGLETMSSGQSRSANAWEAYNGPIYEIPVVVHIIESTNPADANLKLTDEEIKTWIDNANKMFATTYGGSYFPEGDGIRGGNVMPFKLVLAKRTANCEATTGIVRYDGSSLEEYNDYGMRNNNTSRGATLAQVRGLAPHWPEQHYYNIYIVTGLSLIHI